MRKLVNKNIAAIAAGAIVVASAGAAYAYWTTSGSGTGTGSAAAPQATTALTFGTSAITPMFPGDTLQDVTTTVTNTGTQDAYVTQVKAYLTVAKKQVPNLTTEEDTADTVDAYAGTCSSADFLLGDAAASAANAQAGTTASSPVTLTWTATDLDRTSGTANATGKVGFNNLGSNQDGCKEAVVTLNYVAS